MTDPAVTAWSDQFGALLRDKVRLMQRALLVSGFTNMVHAFEDPDERDGETWKITFFEDDFWLTCVTGEDAGEMVCLNLEALGVNRR